MEDGAGEIVEEAEATEDDTNGHESDEDAGLECELGLMCAQMAYTMAARRKTSKGFWKGV